MKILKTDIFPKIRYDQQIQLFLVLLVCLLFIVNLAYSFLFRILLENLELDSQRRLKLVATNIADRINGKDLEQLLQGSRWYSEFYNILGREKLKIANLEENIDIHVLDNENRILDSQETPLLSQLTGFAEAEKSDLANAWSGKITITGIYESQPGVFEKSCFYPLRDTRGNIVAVLFTTMDLTPLSALQRISTWIFRMSIFLFLLILAISISFLRYVLKPYRQISEYARDFSVKHSDSEHSNSRKPGSESEVDFSVKTFRETIQALEEKDRLLHDAILQLQERAASVESLNENILQSISTGVITFGEDNRITNINRFACNLLGLSIKEIENRFCEEVFGADSMPGKILSGIQESAPIIEWTVTPEGRDQKNLALVVSPLRDQHNNIIGKILLIEDMTEIRKLQEKIMLKEQMATLGEMSVGIAHEIRNPLAVIMGYANLLLKNTRENDPLMDSYKSIIQEVYSTEKIIQDFLTFARPAQLCPEPTNLNDIARDTLEPVKNDLENAGIRLHLHLDEKLPEVSVDPGLIQSVVRNLIWNARDAMIDSHDRNLSVSTGINPENGSEIYISIKDTGSGIDPNTRSKIFLPFFTGKEKGTGLGLAIVQKIVLSHDGRIDVDSTPGEGSTFIVYLPNV